MKKFRKTAIIAFVLTSQLTMATGASVKTCRDDEQFGWDQQRISTAKENRMFEMYRCFDGRPAAEFSQNDLTACNWFVGKSINDIWNYPDFYDVANQRYFLTDEVNDTFLADRGWKKLGNASSQDVLKEAEAKAFGGYPVIAHKPGHIAIILPGGLMNSSTWNLNVPRAAQFRIGGLGAAFVGCRLSWSWKPDDKETVGIYVKCGPVTC